MRNSRCFNYALLDQERGDVHETMTVGCKPIRKRKETVDCGDG